MHPSTFRIIKPEIRVLGVDDGVVIPHSRGFALVVGVVFRGGRWLEGVMHTKVKIDGLDATDQISSMILASPHHKQLRIIMLNGVTFAGFNVVDIKKISQETRLPTIAVADHMPDFEEIRKALQNLPKSDERWKTLWSGGEIHSIPVSGRNRKLYTQIAGLAVDDVRKIIQLTSTRSGMPEPLRVAHIVASGVTET